MKLSLSLLFSFLLFLSVTATLATAATGVASEDVDCSHEYPRHVLLRKYAKKTAHVPPLHDGPTVCSIDWFPRVSKYQNCQGVEYTVNIHCAPRHRMCSYTEHYVNGNGEKCKVQGSFDPIAQIGTDLARPGVCHLKFVPLTDSCDVDALPGFGMKAEVDMSTGHADNDEACTSSLMLLRFSRDGGFVYYNKDTPRKAIALDCAFPTPPKRHLEENPKGPPEGPKKPLCPGEVTGGVTGEPENEKFNENGQCTTN